jgi:hypothetical protein
MKTVLGLEGAVRRPDPEVADEDDSRGELEDYSEGLHNKIEVTAAPKVEVAPPSNDDDLDDIMAKFQKLAEA